MSEPQRSCVIIGIAGASASGKSLIAHTIFEELVMELGEDQIGVITEDCYYKDQSHLAMEERVKTNYDHPSAFDHRLLADHLSSLLQGEAVEIAIDGLTTQAKYYEPLVYEFMRKEWTSRPSWGDYVVEIVMEHVGDPPWMDLDNLAKALLAREAAQRQAAAGNKAAAVLAYVDYQAARARLTTASAAAAATKLQTDWNTARDAQLSAAADLLAAQLAVIQGQLALARKRAEMTARLTTRDAVASAAVDAVLNPPAPPGP